jgi:hypothetical protein
MQATKAILAGLSAVARLRLKRRRQRLGSFSSKWAAHLAATDGG